MRSKLALLLLMPLAGCPNKTAPAEDKPADKAEKTDDTYHPYKDARPAKVKADVEAAQKKEEDRDDKILDKAKQ